MGFPKFKDLTKSERDLLNEHYNQNKALGSKIKNKTSDSTTVTLKFAQAGFSGSTASLKDLDGEVNVKYEKGDVQIEAIATAGQELSSKIEFKPRKYLENTKLVYVEKINPVAKTMGVNMGVEYENDNVTAQTSLDFSYPKLETFNASIVAGKEQKAVALDTKYSFAKNSFTYYNLVFWRKFNTNLWALSLNMKPDAKLPNYELSYFHTLRPDLKFAAKATGNLKDNSSTVQIGGDWQIDDSTTLKTRLSSNNTAAAVYRKKLSNNLTFNLATETNTNLLHSKVNAPNFNYGVYFEYTA